MEKLLHADGPYPEHRDQLMLYGQFVGAWDIDNTYFLPDGEEQRARREWHFGWVLGGRGVQDVLFARGAPAHRYGSSLRCYFPEEDSWRIAWMGPAAGQHAWLTGRPSPEGILQEGGDEDGLIRWTFTDITPDSFTWQGFASADDGASWRLVQRMYASRVSG
jgi:hypothetical protein